ncbi:MAG: hypothetical protein IJ746_07710 [Ruminococcus sp.]|nr:hypothetical protein [Ruminococcus sp.]
MRYSDEQIICAMMNSTTVKAAAAELGCCESTIYKRLPDLRSELRERQLLLLDETTAALRAKLSKAVDVVAEIAFNTAITPQTRLNAAETLMRNALRFTGFVSGERQSIDSDW